MDAFRAFDLDSKGYITQMELTMGLISQKIDYNLSELQTFFKTYDFENSKKLKFSEFSKAFLPVCDKEFAVSIIKR